MQVARWLFILALLSAFACSSEGSDETTSSTSTGSGGSGGSGPLPTPMVHRADATACSGMPPPGNATMDPGGACMVDADCTDGMNGRCIWPFGGNNLCAYDECMQDGDCGGESICACRVDSYFQLNRCYQGNCQTDSDCGDGGYCSPSAVEISPSCMEGISPGSVGFFCHAPQDACTDDSDCGSPDEAVCLFSVDALSWVCQPLLCVL